MKRTIIIAEAGVNHNGSIAIAKQLIDASANAGADYVKFQTFKADKLTSKIAEKAAYQKNLTNSSETQQTMLKRLELDNAAHVLLLNYCKSKKIEFLSTAFDLESINLLGNLGLKIFKIPSGEITNLPYLKKIGSLKKQVILSTGMAEINEIRDAMLVLTSAGTKKEDITVLHCNTEYPTPMEDVNLKAMQTIARTFHVQVGYSDHTLGIEIPIAAVSLGATIIEKHFTLDRTMEGPDHKASLEPSELKAMVSAIRNIEKALGKEVKQPSPSEIKNQIIARKSIHLAKSLKKGVLLKEEDLVMKRPGDGISPMLMEQIVGKKLKENKEADYKLTFADLE